MVREVPVLETRLFNTGLTRSPFSNAAAAVGHLGAVQAQDFALSKWSLGLRIKDATEKAIEKSYDDGSILRVHVLRPTWHFVLPQDIGWMTALTGPRIKAGMAAGNRKLEIDDKLIVKTNNAIIKALQEQKYLNRQQLKQVLETVGVITNVQRLAHIIALAELDGLICSGPRCGKQLTYALTAERVKKPLKLDKEEAIAALARKYFGSHGPAQLEDFSWWSGLNVREARTGLESVKPGLASLKNNGREYWYDGNLPESIPVSSAALLLPIYDEYVIAYKDRRDISSARDVEKMIMAGNTFTSVLVIDGKVAGSWKKKAVKNGIEIKLDSFKPLSEKELAAVKKETVRYASYSGLPVTLVY